MSSFIRKDYSTWHNVLLKWVRSTNTDDKHAGYLAYLKVLDEIALSLNKPDESCENDEEIFLVGNLVLFIYFLLFYYFLH